MPELEALAREALAEITRPEYVGALVAEERTDDAVVTLSFATLQSGYPGWRWTVALAEVEGGDATVLETELVPGEGALLAPDWVPWADRLEEYRAAQAAAAAAEEVDDDDDFDLDDAEDEDDVDDGIDFEPDEESVLGRVDAVAPAADAVAEGDGEQEESDADAGDADPEPVRPARRRQRRKRGE